MAEEFVSRNLTGSLFRDVSLTGARFEDVNLAGARLRNVSLANVEIRDADLRGLKIFGVEIEPLIEAEFDRRFPIRQELRPKDEHSPFELARIFQVIGDHRKAVRTRLARAPFALLCQRPEEDRWSAIEHLCHLYFAETMYLDRWIKGRDTIPDEMALRPAFLVSNPVLGAAVWRSPDSLSELLERWLPVWEEFGKLLEGLDEAALKAELPKRDFGKSSLGRLLAGAVMHHWLHLHLAGEALDAAEGGD
jgi:hypothetical protein